MSPDLDHDRARDDFRLHAYVDGEFAPDEVVDFERALSLDAGAMAEVAAIRAQKQALHARYDTLLTAPSADDARRFTGRSGWVRGGASGVGTRGLALAATVLLAAGVGIVAGWIGRGQTDPQPGVAGVASSDRLVERRLQSFVQTAALSHAVFVPEVRHPVEVAAADEAHLVTWLSKRLAAPLVVPHLGDAGWELLGGRLLPDESGPVAQFMYQDKGGHRLTLAVSKSVAGRSAAASAARAAAAVADPVAEFRIAESNGSTVFYWIDADYAYALTGKLSKSEMTAIASRVYRQLDRDNAQGSLTR